MRTFTAACAHNARNDRRIDDSVASCGLHLLDEDHHRG